jgi:hypothetical protein
MKKLLIISFLVVTVSITKAQNDYPSARTGHTLTIVNDNLHMFGGEEVSKNKSTKDVIMNSIHHTFMAAENKWETEPESSPEPSGRTGHAAIGYNGKMIISCGQTENGYDNGIWEYDVNTQTWSNKTITGATIEPRKNHTMGAYGNYIYILGGQDQNGDVTSCYKIDINTWEATSIGNIPTQGGKAGCALLIENGYIVIAGGETNGQTTGNISIYDISGDTWTTVTGNNDFAFAGAHSNWIIGGHSQAKKSNKELLNTIYFCTFTPPTTFTMTAVSNSIPQGEYFNSFVQHFSLTPNYELDSTFYFWGGTNNQTFYSYRLPSDGEDDTLSIYDPTGQSWVITGIENILSDNKIKIYPNPVNQVLNITSENSNIKAVRIFNIYGQEVIILEHEFDNKINVETLSNGIYIIEVEALNKRNLYKFIKQ